MCRHLRILMVCWDRQIISNNTRFIVEKLIIWPVNRKIWFHLLHNWTHSQPSWGNSTLLDKIITAFLEYYVGVSLCHLSFTSLMFRWSLNSIFIGRSPGSQMLRTMQFDASNLELLRISLWFIHSYIFYAKTFIRRLALGTIQH